MGEAVSRSEVGKEPKYVSHDQIGGGSTRGTYFGSPPCYRGGFLRKVFVTFGQRR